MPLHIDVITSEFEKRKAKNPRYSLRAFASFLGLHPSALSRILSTKQLLSPRAGLTVSQKLQLDSDVQRKFLRSIIQSRKDFESKKLGVSVGAPMLQPDPIRFFEGLDPQETSIQKEALEQAISTLDVPSPERAHFGIAMTIDPEKLPVARERIIDFIESLADELETGSRRADYRLGVQLFPVSKKQPSR